MGTSLAALLIMAVFFTGVILMYRTTLAGNVAVSSAIREASNSAVDRARTNLRIVDLQTKQCNVELEIHNVGTIAISDYDDMDVIVTMDTFQEELQARRFQYSDGAALIPNSWVLDIDADADDEDIYGDYGYGDDDTFDSANTVSIPVKPPVDLGDGEAVIAKLISIFGATKEK